MANKTKRFNDTEDEEIQMNPSSLRERIWEAQANEKELIINGVIDDSLIELIVFQIQNMNSMDDQNELQVKSTYGADAIYTREPIKLFINSTGGDMHSAFSIISAIKASRTPVWTIALGKAYSAAFMILISGDMRYAQQYTDAMYHQGASGVAAKFMDMYEYGDYLERLDNKIQDFVLEHTLITEEDLEECHLRKIDWYMDAKDLLEYSCIDSIWGFGDLSGILGYTSNGEEVEEEAISE